MDVEAEDNVMNAQNNVICECYKAILTEIELLTDKSVCVNQVDGCCFIKCNAET